MTDNPVITKNEFEGFLELYISENIYTLANSSLIFIESHIEQRIINVSHANSNITFNIAYEDIYAFYLMVSELKSFRVTDYMDLYNGPKNQINSLLSIVQNVMDFCEISYVEYIKPGQNKNKMPRQVIGLLEASINMLKETGVSRGYLNKKIMETEPSQNSLRNIMKQTLIIESEAINIVPLDGESYGLQGQKIDQIDRIKTFDRQKEGTRPSEEPLIVDTVEKKESHRYSEIDVFYATNRQCSSNKKILYTNERDSDNILQYGKAVITIPDSHKKGQIERPIFKYIFAESKRKHFTVLNGNVLDRDSFFDSIKKNTGKSVMIFIHGFNVSFKDGLLKAAQLKKDLQYEDPIILFSWPSKGKIPLYVHDKTNADFSSEDFKSLVEQLANKGIENIYIIAHSMGAYCATIGLSDINPNDLPNLKNLIFAAPDIDIGTFRKKYAKKLSMLFNNFTIYMSKTDRALSFSKRANGYERLGDTTRGVSVFDDIDSIDATGISGFFSLRHSYISEEPLLIHDLNNLIFNNQDPKQRGLIKSKNNLSQLYWKFI